MKTRSSVILVGGYLGEFLRLPFIANYFSAIESILKRSVLGLHVRHIQIPFYQRLKCGVENVASEVLQQTSFFETPTVVVAHSRGALEAWTALLKHPYLLKSENLKYVHIMSPPVGGTPLANVISSYLKGWLPKFVLKPLLEMKLNSRRQNYLQKLYFGLSADEKNLIRQKVRFHTTCCKVEKLPWPLRVLNFLLKVKLEESDGLLPLSSQVQVPKVHYNWSTHHGSLFCNGLVATHGKKEWNLFCKILQNSFKPAAPLTATYGLSQRLRISTYNTGMLNIPIWGVPHCRERLQHMPKTLDSFQSDFICVQESFEKIEYKNLNYKAFTDGPTAEHGLVTLIRKSLLERYKTVKVHYKAFRSQRAVELLANFQKGYLITDLIQDNKRVRIVNLHFTAFSSAKYIRSKQLKELAELVLSSIKNHQVVVCGDFNMEFNKKSELPTFKRGSKRLDHIFAFCRELGQLRPLSEEVLLTEAFVPTKKNKVELSDHYLLKADFQGVS